MGFEAMYNNSVAIAGSDKCQHGTGRKGPETQLLLLPGPGWDREVAGAGGGSHSQGQGSTALLPSTVGRGASSTLLENWELQVCLGWAPVSQRFLQSYSGGLGQHWSSGSSSACPGSQLWFSSLRGMLGHGVFFPVVVVLAAAGAHQGTVSPQWFAAHVALPDIQTPCLGGCPQPGYATACSELPPHSQGHQHLGIG